MHYYTKININLIATYLAKVENLSSFIRTGIIHAVYKRKFGTLIFPHMSNKFDLILAIHYASSFIW